MNLISLMPVEYYCVDPELKGLGLRAPVRHGTTFLNPKAIEFAYLTKTKDDNDCIAIVFVGSDEPIPSTFNTFEELYVSVMKCFRPGKEEVRFAEIETGLGDGKTRLWVNVYNIKHVDELFDDPEIKTSIYTASSNIVSFETYDVILEKIHNTMAQR